jgi:hypothetical protein
VENAIRLVDALVWPMATLALVLLLLTRPGRGLVAGIGSRVKRVSAFGVEFELTPESATRVKADLEETLRTYRAAIVSEFDRQASILHIPDLRRRVVEDAVIPNLNVVQGVRPSYRCTIHVRDILLHEAMYQLLEYLPAAGSRSSGRTFSMRFGIVGQAWRTGESQMKEDIQPGDPYVITDWGMLPEEAAAAGFGRRSFAAAVLQEGVVTVGVLYVDSSQQLAFNDHLNDEVRESSARIGLTSALAQLERTMRARGPALTIFDA